MFLSTLLILASIGGKAWGIIIPTLIFILSFMTTWLLYKHFSSK